VSTELVPFRRGRWDELPDAPVRPHAYERTEARTVRVESRPFGAIDVHVRVFGSGPPLLLIHGLMTSSYSWRYVFEELGAAYTVYAPDLPGSGKSGKPRARYGAAETAEFIGELMCALGIRGCDVVGNSLGGYLCMRLALADPESMARLVNIHSPGVPELRLYALRFALLVPGIRAVLAWFIGLDPLRWAWRNVHYRDEGLKSLEEARAYGGPLSEPAGARAFVEILGDTVAPGDMSSFQVELATRKAAGQTFPVPLQLLWARADPMVPARLGPLFAARIPSAELRWVEDASHFAHVDQPEATVAFILEFLLRPLSPPG
jgi:pimeloyl-ACP methyl ester carboxylesterase